MKKFRLFTAICSVILSINALSITCMAQTEKTEDINVGVSEKEQCYTITYDKNGGTGTIDNTSPVEAGKDVKLSVWALKRDGYSHTGWTDGENIYDRGQIIKMPATDLKLTAVWVKLYNVIYEDFTDIGYGNPLSSGTVASGTEVYLPNLAMFKGDAMFNGWRVNGEYYAPQTTFIMPQEDVEVKADWLEPITFAYSAGDVDGVTTEPIIYTKKYPGAEFFTGDAPSIARLGYKISGWHLVGTDEYYGTSDSYRIPDKDSVFEVVWKPIIIAVSFNPNGGTGTMEKLKPNHDDVIKLPECTFVKDGYKLLGWNLKDEYYQPQSDFQVKISEFGESLKFNAVWIEEDANPGDLNGDGVVDLTDMTILSLHISGDCEITDSTILRDADVLKDNELNVGDIAYFKQFICCDKILLGMSKEGE